MSEIINVNVTKIEELVTINALPNVTQIVVTTSSGGAVESVNGQNGIVELTTNDIPETATKVYLTPAEKTAITHTNRTILDAITEAFTTTLKSSYDSAVNWISTNGATLISHLTDYANPHQTTASQVGAYTTSETDTLLSGKVDKITGKGLSTNDYTDTEKTKLAGIEDGATNVTKTSDLINDGDDGNAFISLLDLPSNLILYPTTAASDISGYSKLVTDIHDPSYNTTAVDVSTGAISGTAQLISSLATSASVIVGNPGVFNITTIGNISRTAGSGQAEFFFRVYKRTSAGVETFITQSANTIPVIDGGTYVEFSATGLWDDGIFLVTDRIVLKFYANRITGGSNPTYNFQFGGISPVRSLVPIPLSVVPSIGLDGLNDVTITTPLEAQVLGYENSTSLWKNKSIPTWLGFTPEDTSNKVTTFTSNETSTTKFPVVKAIIDYFTSSRLATILGFTPANDASVVHLAGVETIIDSKTIQGTTQTGSSAVGILNLSQTWNTTGTPTALKLNVTDTASNTSSLLMDLQVGGSSRVSVSKSGTITANDRMNASFFSAFTGTTSNSFIYYVVNPTVNATSGLTEMYKTGGVFSPTSGTATYTGYSFNPQINQTGGATGATTGLLLNPTLTSAANYVSILSNNGKLLMTDTYSAGPTALTATGILDLRQTFNTTGTPTAIRLNVTDTASNAGSLLMDLQVGGASIFYVKKSGEVVSPSIIYARQYTLSSGVSTLGADFDSGLATISNTSGNFNVFGIAKTFSPTSGISTFTGLNFATTINQTGTSNGITRGIHFNPTLTNAFDFRAIEVTKGSIVLPYQAATTTYAVKTSDYLLDFTTGTFTATLPTAAGCVGKNYVFKNSGTGIITIATTSSQTIDGVTTSILATQYATITVVSNGANWIKI